jgi:hypothetical protein
MKEVVQTHSYEEGGIMPHFSLPPNGLLVLKQMPQSWTTTQMTKPLLPLLEDAETCGQVLMLSLELIGPETVVAAQEQ